jgi:Leucine-rich repeat (LRR) protein
MIKTIRHKHLMIGARSLAAIIICYSVSCGRVAAPLLNLDTLPATVVIRNSRGEIIEVSSSSLEFDDAALIALRGEHKIEELVLFDTSVTDSGVKHLASKKNMKHFAIDGSKITDHSIVIISQMKNLNWLTVSNASITDDSVPYITKLKKLDFLDISKTKISPDGIQRIRNELPECEVSY